VNRSPQSAFVRLPCDNFRYGLFKGAPAARQPSGPLGRIGRSERDVVGGECVTGRPDRRESQSGRAVGYPLTVGRRPAAPLRAGALRARRRAPVSWPRTRRPVAQAVTLFPTTAAALSDRPSSAPGILSPRKDHRQGRTQGRVADAMAQAPPLTLIFPGKTSAPIRRTGMLKAGGVRPKQR
jgi:hypothetical protein